MQGQMIDIAATDGSGTFQGYLALPPAGRGPGLVLAQEIFGVNATMRETADAFAAQGYAVLVPDLFWRQTPGVQLGYTPEDWQRAFDFYKGFDEALGVQDIQAALNTLRQRPECSGPAIGVVGYCLGGKLAYLAACRTDAAVSVGYYGVGIENNLDEAKHIRGQLTLHLAENDSYCPPEARQNILAALAPLPNVQCFTYPGMEHAFARIRGEHYDAAAATLANQRTADAFRRVLGPH
ncbi:MAG: dienelactone hydrolase family protein [Comamonadaceae bacterium]|nr:dienelactone hydrolase family protein [Comamonadaceae bacterium]